PCLKSLKRHSENVVSHARVATIAFRAQREAGEDQPSFRGGETRAGECPPVHCCVYTTPCDTLRDTLPAASQSSPSRFRKSAMLSLGCNLLAFISRIAASSSVRFL